MSFRRIIKALVAAVLGGILFGVMYTDAHETAQGGKLLRLDLLAAGFSALALAAGLLSFFHDERQGVRRVPGPLAVTLWILSIVLVSGVILHPRFFFIEWAGKRWDVSYDHGFYRWLLFSIIMVPLLTKLKSRSWAAVLLILVYAQYYAFSSLMKETHGLALYRDDHPSFMFRLHEFTATFPLLLNYNPFWNGGVESFVGVSSGIASVGLPLYPLLKVYAVEDCYTPGLGLLFIVVMPWVAVAGLRVAGCRLSGAFAGGILALAAGCVFFLWMLHFGTVGAAFSSFFIMPLSAVSMGVVWLNRSRWYHFVFLAVCACMLLLWPPGALMAAPLALSFLLSLKKLSRKKVVFLSGAAACTGLLVLHHFLVILLRGDELMTYVTDKSASFGLKAFLDGVGVLVRAINRINPLIVYFGATGLIFSPCRSMRKWMGPVIVWLAVLAGWGAYVEPKMQLERMIIPMAFALVVPAAFACGRIFDSRGGMSILARAFLAGLLLMCGRSAGQFYGNKSAASYVAVNEQLHNAVEWIEANVPEGSRLLFAGRAVHAFNRGHIAYLPVLAGREMMACDYYHFPPELVEYNYPPAGIRSDVEQMDKFLKVYAVSCILTYKDHASWIEYFDSRPGRFERLEPGPGFDFYAYRVKDAGSLFVENSGVIAAGFNRITVELDDPARDAVLGYNWSDRLEVSGTAEILPFQVCEDIVLLGIKPNGEKRVEISFRGM